MKNIFWIVFFSFQLGFSQNYLVEKLPSRVRLSWESIQMESEANIGFLGHGYELFGLFKKQPNLYFGVNSYAAITGIRSGFIVFGVTGGVQKYVYKDWLSYDAGLFLGGGGGSGAPDGGGLMIRPHIDLQADITKQLSLRAGFSGVTFPSGEINSWHFNVGATIKSNTYIANTVSNSTKSGVATSFNKITLSALSINLLNYSKGPLGVNTVVNKNASPISLIGALVKTNHKESNFYGALKLAGAFSGGVDGFMMLLTGVGYELPLTNWFSLDAKGMIGGAGGGAVGFGGGLATQIEAGVGFNFLDYNLNVNLGNTYAPNGNFQSNHVDVAIGKKFNLYANSKINNSEIVEGKNVKKEDFTFSVFNRSYFSGDKADKEGRAYDAVFNLLGFEVGKKLNDTFNMIAATVWAYQGNYGAYAEGWLGLEYCVPIKESWRFTTKGLIGAGGGGNIDLGSGLAYQYSIGIEKQLNNRWSLISNLGQVRGVEGNFTPILLDIGVKININQLVKN